ncbi:hypothetical protein [Novipirellula rosea]|uniref:hypothetical protein n=1 Tax=Novipirellula rosea TaxID=1031540 RepID=UPI0031E698BB
MLKKKWRSVWREGIDPATQSAVVADHQKHRHHLALKRGLPFTGAYYWIPSKANQWSILVFPNAFYEDGEAGHVDVWQDVVRILSCLHHLNVNDLVTQISNCPYGLPRGRVVRMGTGQWGVAHGGDQPTRTNLESTVSDAFCLKGVHPNFFFDEHEQMLPEDWEQTRLALSL